MNFNKINVSFFITMLICFIACGPPETSENSTSTGNTTALVKTKPIKAKVIPPVFNEDSAYAFVKYQADLGPRNPGTKAHSNCAIWLENKLKSYGAVTQIQTGIATTFDQKKWTLKNVIGSFNSENVTRVLLCSHWDSRPFCDRDSNKINHNKPCPGVNDGASGVGVLLEMARLFAQKNPKIGVDIVFFDLEDYGQTDDSKFPAMENSWCLGSQYWAQNPHKPGYFAQYGILLDMVGAKNATFAKEGNSVFTSSSILDKVWNTGYDLGFSNYFTNVQFQEITDDHIYINRILNIPCIDIIDYKADKRDFFPHHHRITDNIDNIDKATLSVVGKTLMEVIYNEEH